MKTKQKTSKPLSKQQTLEFNPYFPKNRQLTKHQDFIQNIDKRIFRYDEKKFQLPKSKSYSCSHRQRQKSKSFSKQNNKNRFQQTLQMKKINQKLRQQQINEQYNLQSVPKNKNEKMICDFELHNCKHIQNYLLKIKNELSAQKQKNKILKRRNNELTKQNKVFNQYFQIFQPKYEDLMTKFNNSGNSYDINQKKSSSKAKHSKSHGKLIQFDKFSQSKDKINGQISYSKLTLKTSDPTKSSFITNKSSKDKSKQFGHNSRLEEFYSHC